tara:strand:- start:45 stop:578 length:534 start_codon:yes stop_codon:yes gene_type:complete
MATNKANKTSNPAEEAVTAAFKATEEYTAKGVEAVETAIAMGEDAVKEGMDKVDAFAKDQTEAFQSGYTQAATYAAENLNAAFNAAKEANQGWNTYAQQVMDYTKKAFAENMVMAEKFAAAKTPEDFVTLQNEVANKAANRISSQATKLNDIAQKSAAKTIEPLKQQAEKNLKAFTG